MMDEKELRNKKYIETYELLKHTFKINNIDSESAMGGMAILFGYICELCDDKGDIQEYIIELIKEARKLVYKKS